MIYLLATLLFATTLLMIVLARYVWLQQKALDQALKEISGDEEQLPDSDPEMILTVRVLNPIDVACQESRSARIVAPHMPTMVTKIVYKEVLKEISQELSERGIEADLNVEYR